MKKLNFIVPILLFIFAFTLQSCIDDDNDQWDHLANAKWAIVTTHLVKPSSSEFYFTLDNGKTIQPTIRTNVINYQAKEGQKVYIGLILLDKQEGSTYDYQAEILYIDDILTKEIIPLTKKTADSIGDNSINITHKWIAQGYLNLEFQYFGSGNIDKKHMLNLVQNESTEVIDKDGYINLEFRHNAFNDIALNLGSGLVSFKLNKIENEMKNAKGIKIRVKTIYEDIQYYKINFKDESGESDIFTEKQLDLTIDMIQ